MAKLNNGIELHVLLIKTFVKQVLDGDDLGAHVGDLEVRTAHPVDVDFGLDFAEPADGRPLVLRIHVHALRLLVFLLSLATLARVLALASRVRLLAGMVFWFLFLRRAVPDLLLELGDFAHHSLEVPEFAQFFDGRFQVDFPQL